MCPNWSKPSIRGGCLCEELSGALRTSDLSASHENLLGDQELLHLLCAAGPFVLMDSNYQKVTAEKTTHTVSLALRKRLVSTFVKKQWSAAKVAQWTDCKYEHQPTDRPRRPWPKHKFQDGSAAACGSSLILFPKPVKHLLTTNLKCWSCWSVEWTVLPCKCKSWTWKFALLGWYLRNWKAVKLPPPQWSSCSWSWSR